MSGSILISSDSSEDVKPVISGDYDEKTVDDGSTIIDTCSSSESKGIIQISVATPTPPPTSPIPGEYPDKRIYSWCMILRIPSEQVCQLQPLNIAMVLHILLLTRSNRAGQL